MNKTKAIGFVLILVSLIVVSGQLGFFLSMVVPSDSAPSSVTIGDWSVNGALRYRNKVLQKVLLPSDNEVITSVGVVLGSFNYDHNDLTYQVGLALSVDSQPFWSAMLPLHSYSSYGDLVNAGYTSIATGNVTVNQDYVYVMLWCNAPDSDSLDDSAYLFYADGDLTTYTDAQALVSENGEIVECDPLAFCLELAEAQDVVPDEIEGIDTDVPLVSDGNLTEGETDADLLQYSVGGVCACAGVFLIWLGNKTKPQKKRRRGKQ
ncbi:MAG: hypothetical protein ACOWW1_09705 [archaeon]